MNLPARFLYLAVGVTLLLVGLWHVLGLEAIVLLVVGAGFVVLAAFT